MSLIHNEKLNNYSNNITSQHGEDGIIDYILKYVMVPKVCVEFGAWDGKFLSNTYTLWHEQNWEGILIEADLNRSEKTKNEYQDFNIKIINQFLVPKGKGSLDNIFKEYSLPREVGILSIDVDSTDYFIWKHLKFVDPYIVIIEHNHTIPGFVNYHDPEGEIFLRCSAKALELLGIKKGYKLICCTVTNSIFVKNDIYNREVFPDLTAECLFDYSNINVMISASQGPANNLIPMVSGIPSKVQKYIYPPLNRLRALFTGKKYKKPGEKVMQQLKKAGISIL